jgi:hypothetical protein
MSSRLADERTIDRDDRAARSRATASRTSRAVMPQPVMHRLDALERIRALLARPRVACTRVAPG